MSDTVAFRKILHIRENEKKRAEQLHQQSIQAFEKIAMQMYEMLKKKEATEQAYENDIQKTVQLEKMEQTVRYIEQLNDKITRMQQQVNDARTEMNYQQQLVTTAHMEMKKVEKLIEKRNEEYQHQLSREENAFMDELSMQQFLKRKLGESIV